MRAAYGGNYDRLGEGKRTYDPANMFRLKNNIDPGRRARVASSAARVRYGGEQS